MIQEIITYILIVLAVTITVIRTIKRFGKKKKKVTTDFKKETFTLEHNCSECSADCMLRNAPLKTRKKNEQVCNDLHTKLN